MTKQSNYGKASTSPTPITTPAATRTNIHRLPCHSHYQQLIQHQQQQQQKYSSTKRQNQKQIWTNNALISNSTKQLQQNWTPSKLNSNNNEDGKALTSTKTSPPTATTTKESSSNKNASNSEIKSSKRGNISISTAPACLPRKWRHIPPRQDKWWKALRVKLNYNKTLNTTVWHIITFIKIMSVASTAKLWTRPFDILTILKILIVVASSKSLLYSISAIFYKKLHKSGLFVSLN